VIDGDGLVGADFPDLVLREADFGEAVVNLSWLLAAAAAAALPLDPRAGLCRVFANFGRGGVAIAAGEVGQAGAAFPGGGGTKGAAILLSTIFFHTIEEKNL